MTSKKHEFEHDVKLDVEARVLQPGCEGRSEEVLEEEMAEHLQAGYRGLTPPGEESETATTSVTW